MSLLVNNNPQVLWRETIKEAVERCDIALENNLEAYLASLLARYADKPELAKRLFAEAIMHAAAKSEAERDVLMQQVGDECLLYSGLFPRSARKKHVSIRYFVEMGRTAYGTISTETSDLFGRLATKFVLLMDVLQSIKAGTDLLPLEAYEQWEAVGSLRAWNILQKYRR